MILSLYFLFGGVFSFATRGIAMSAQRFLVKGIGLQGVLEIGDTNPSIDWAEREWLVHPSDLKFKVDAQDPRRPVVLIKCDQGDCVTDRNVKLGTLQKTVLSRFGAPLQKKQLKNDRIFFGYHGVGFEFVNNRVHSIYIFPRFEKAK